MLTINYIIFSAFFAFIKTVIEVATKTYGDFQKELVATIQNGKIVKWQAVPSNKCDNYDILHPKLLEAKPNLDNTAGVKKKYPSIYRNSWFSEFKILFLHILHQMWRDKVRCFGKPLLIK